MVHDGWTLPDGVSKTPEFWDLPLLPGLVDVVRELLELRLRDTLADVLGLDQVLGRVLAFHAGLGQALDHLVERVTRVRRSEEGRQRR